MSEELAWAAGFFDGEGCFTTWRDPTTTRIRPIMSISQKDRRVLDRFRDAVGAVGPQPRLCTRRSDGGSHYYYHVSGESAVEQIFGRIKPWLSPVKLEQAERVFHRVSTWDTTPEFSLERLFEMPSSWTFEQPKTRAWVESRLKGNVLNLFGGKTRLTVPENGSILYNDLNEELEADIRLDATKVDQWQDYAGKFDCVIFDPPFSDHQAVVTYGIKKAQRVTHARDVVNLVLNKTGRVISLGYNSTGMGRKRGFVKESLLLVNHGGSHSDTLVLSESRQGE